MAVIDCRITIYDPKGNVLFPDVSHDVTGGQITYEDTPAGCGAAKIPLGLRPEEIRDRGYWIWPNMASIHTGDNTLKTNAGAGANKYYLTEGTANFDPALGEDAQVAYFYDGATLTMLVPVTGVGTDAGGAYITTGNPIGGGAVPAYVAGTIVGRRRYTGRIGPRDLVYGRMPTGSSVTLVGLSVAFSQASGSFTISAGANVDVGAAIYGSLSQFVARWPFFKLVAANFPVVGSTYHGTLTDVMCDRLIADALSAVTTGDYWTVRVGHDLTPRLIKLFAQATNTYTYNVPLLEGSFEYEPTSIEITDQDPSNVFNQVMIVGDTDPTTNQPVKAIVQDPAAVTAAGGLVLDGAPVNNQGIKDVTGASQYGLSQLSQHSLPVSTNKLVVYTKNDTIQGQTPNGAVSGDVVRAVAAVSVLGSDQAGVVSNFVPDSGFEYASAGAASSTWRGGSGAYASGALSLTGKFSSAYSLPIVVQPGQKWTFSGFLDTTNAAGDGNPGWFIDSYTFAGGIGGAIAQTPNPALKKVNLSTTFTIPAGVTLIVIFAYNGGDSGTTAFSQPMLTKGPAIVPYVANLGSPVVYGLPSSVVTQIDLDQYDTQQQVSFAAIDPDWNTQLLEAANAVATQLRSNQALLNAIDQYCVSSDVRGYTTSTTSLSVTWPTFLAIFAPGSAIATLGGNGTALVANSTNWVWVQANGSYTVNLSAAPVQGAILLGIFQTNANGVIGSVLKASIGVLKVGVGNINAATNLPAPMAQAGSVTISNGPSINGMAADVLLSGTLTNVPQDATGVLWVFRKSGTTTWNPYGESNLAQQSGSAYPQTSQAVSFDFGAMDNGATYDFGVAYVSLAGYGPVSLAAQNFVAVAIGIPTAYMVGGVTIVPTQINGGAVTSLSANGINAAAYIQFQATNQPTDGRLSRVQFWIRPSALASAYPSMSIGDLSNFAWSPYGGAPATGVGTANPPANAVYRFNAADLMGNTAYDFAFSYEDGQGFESTLCLITSNFVATVLNLPTTANASIPTAIFNAGPNIVSPITLGTQVAIGAGAVGQPFSFSISDGWTAGNQPGWFAGFRLYWRVHGDTNVHDAGALGVTGSVTGIPASIQLGAGGTYDIGIAYEGADSTISATTWPAALSNVSTAQINPVTGVAGTGSGNYVPDAQLAHISGTPSNPNNEAYWFLSNGGGTNFGVVAGNANQPFGLFFWKNNVNGSPRWANSQPFTLTAGSTYNLSAYINLINASTSSPVPVSLVLVSGTVSSTNPGFAGSGGTRVATLTGTAGAAGIYNIPVAITTTGTYVVQVSNSGIAVGGSPIYMAEFQVQAGSVYTGFMPSTPVQTQGTDAGTTAHAAASQSVQIALNSSGKANSSALLSAQQSTLPFTTNAVIHTQFNNSSVQFWIDGGSDGAAISFYYPYSTANVQVPNYGTSSALITQSGLTANTAYYLLAYYTPGGWVVQFSQTAYTAAQLQVPISDGYYPVLFSGTTSVATNNLPGYSQPVSRSGCPAIGTEIQTPSGIVLVEDLRAGDFVRAPDGGFVEVYRHRIDTAPLYEVVTDTETIRVDGSHLFDVTGEHSYVNVRDLRAGDKLMAYDLRTRRIDVRDVRPIGEGRFAHIECDRFRYVLGRTISHNVKTIAQPQ